MSFIYIASPYTSPDPAIMEERYLAAEAYTAKLLSQSRWCYSPIVHCHSLSLHHSLPSSFSYWKSYNTALLRVANALHILQLPGWEDSVGVTYEMTLAHHLTIPVTYIKGN